VIRILVADDYLPFRQVLKDFLETANPRLKVVLQASNGRDALNLLEKNPVDVALIDIRMPIMDGLELCRRIRKVLGQDIGIITYTGLNSPRLAAQALQTGADLHFVKPFELYALKGAVLKLGESRKASPAAAAVSAG
jgi:CheY-like chemotaxis protein